MKQKLFVIGLALGLLTVAVPAGMAAHLSVGATDTVGTSAQETADNPSVPGPDDVQTDDETPYEIGTTPTSECHDPEANVSPNQVTSAVTEHAFCGHLYYNENTTWEGASPEDQDYRDDFVGQFDVQRAYYVGNLLLGSCLPMCDDGGDTVPVMNTTWNAAHTAGSQAGLDLTESPEEADEGREGDRYQWYQMQYDIRHAPGIVQDNTGMWEMDGWAAQYPTEHWVGWLYAGTGAADYGLSEGEAITDQHLQNYVDDNVADPETTDQVCGYTPDISFVSTGEQDFCDTPLLWTGYNASAEDGDAMFDSYNDRCRTPTYMCGTIGDQFWEGEAIGLAAYGGDGVEYTAWHWTVAPNQPDCSATQPGFDLDVSDDEAAEPFLAHDVDVYTPPTALSTGPTVSVQGPQEYADALTSDTPDIPGLPQGVQDALDDADDQIGETTSPVLKDDLLERNHVGAESFAIDDNSRQIINEDRTLTEGSCEELTSSEQPDTVDPWVNYIDNGVSTSRAAGFYSGVAGFGTGVGPAGVYGNDADAHDHENDPTTDTYSTNGFVGVFTDKNDDSDYDQIVGSSDSTDTFSPPVYEEGEIQEVGAYPMLWDMQVKTDGGDASVDTTTGCTFTGEKSFPQVMQEAGYGPNTGLAQAMFLKEPTVFYDLSATDPQTLPYADGNNVYVLGNQAVRELWDGDHTESDDHQLGNDVDDLVNELIDYVTAVHDVNGDDIRVLQPGDEMGFDSDYFSQCGESTGGYDSQISFSHTCETDCSGDTIATMYSYEVRDGENLGGDSIPALKIDGTEVDFTDVEDTRWFDIDAFDGDDTRNEERDPTPPTGDE